MNVKTHYLIWPVAVLMLGIVSCKKDVAYQPRPLAAPGMTAQNSDKSFFKGKEIPFLQAGGQLILEGLKDQDFKTEPIVLKIQSLCQEPSSPATHYKESLWQNRYVFETDDLLPEEILLSKAEQAFCDMTLILTDRIGSTHTMQLRQVRITELQKLSSLVLPFLKDGRAIYQNVRDAQIATGGERQVRFLCDEFGGITKVEGGFNLARVMGETLTAKKDFTTPNQRCRLLSRQQSAVEVSAPFTLHIPVLPLVMTTETVRIGAKTNPLRTLPVVRIKIANPNTFEVPVVMEAPQSNIYDFQPATIHQSGLYLHVSPSHSRPLLFAAEPQKAVVKNDAGVLRVQVQAGQEIVLTGYVNFQLYDNKYPGHFFIGVNFDYRWNSKLYALPYENGEQMFTVVPNKSPIATFTGRPYWDLDIAGAQGTTHEWKILTGELSLVQRLQGKVLQEFIAWPH